MNLEKFSLPLLLIVALVMGLGIGVFVHDDALACVTVPGFLKLQGYPCPATAEIAGRTCTFSYTDGIVCYYCCPTDPWVVK